MIEVFFSARHRVLMARITGIYDIDDMTRFDELVRTFVAKHGEVRGLYDFSAAQEIAVPLARLAERAREPSIAGGLRIIVAPKVVGLQMTRLFSEHQSAAGQMAPIVVAKLEEAYVLLGLEYNTDFQPVEMV